MRVFKIYCKVYKNVSLTEYTDTYTGEYYTNELLADYAAMLLSYNVRPSIMYHVKKGVIRKK